MDQIDIHPETTTAEANLFVRLGSCEVCASVAAKYTCPKCEVKSCSLKCLNIHKKELNCNGIRDPTKFVTLNNFTNVDLLNDYRMLEEMTRSVDRLRKKLPKEVVKNGRKILPKRLHKLKLALNDRNIRMHFLPHTFEKHMKNKSYVNVLEKEVFWSIEWIFPNADKLKIFEEENSENKKLSSILHKYISTEVDTIYSERLQFYRASGLANLSYFLKAERVSGEKYYELDGSETLKENLIGKTIIEYPVIYVVLKEHSLLYLENCLDREDIEMLEVKPRKKENLANQVLTNILQEDKMEIEKKSKNLLFITEFSDADLSDEEL